MTLVEPPPPAPAAAAPRGRRWLIAGTVVWALLLLGAGYYSARNDPPTVREQSSIAQAAPVVDRATGELVAAAGPDAVMEISAWRLANGCRISAARDGATLERSLIIRTADADGPAMLDRIAGRLPASYEASARHAGASHRLRADAGGFVDVSGAVTSPGVVTLTVETGCRPQSPEFVAAEPLLRRPVDDVPSRVLAGLGASSVEELPGARVPCPGGGLADTARATGRGALAASALREVAGPGAVFVTDRREVYAYRNGSTGVVVRVDGDRISVTATTSCNGG